ncbi:MAG TPA: hypothetical protein VE688_01595 [Gaiellaceae bacterium]|nr:hypothetical protein [Gaiellaceae bacterium]
MKLCLALIAAAVIGALIASPARANGDPASDVLPFTTVYLSIQDPTKSTAGQDLLSVTHEAAKKTRPIRVAVISQPSDLGLIQSLWPKPQAYAEFLGKELIQFAHYRGTTLIVMPNGYGIFGPQAAKGKPALARLPKPRTSDLEKLAGRGVTAVRAVAPANGYFLAAPKSGSGTPAWLIIVGALGGAAAVAGVTFFALRRWLLAP